MSTPIHPFEIAGLGKAPFDLQNYFESAGTRCDLCGTRIKKVFVIRSVDARQFNVGSDCVLKTNDVHLRQQVKKQIDEVKAASERERIEMVVSLLTRADVLKKLEQVPSPSPWKVKQGETAKDWCFWMMANSEKTGKLKVAKFLDSLRVTP